MLLTLSTPQADLPGRLAHIAANGPTAITHRLDELEREWSAGRMLKATTGLLLVVGLALAAALNPWWLILPAIAGAALLQYMFFNRTWLTEAFKRVGFRSGIDIENERIALRVLRGDFQQLPTVFQVEDRDAISRLEDEGGPPPAHEHEKIDARDAAVLILEHTKAK